MGNGGGSLNVTVLDEIGYHLDQLKEVKNNANFSVSFIPDTDIVKIKLIPKIVHMSLAILVPALMISFALFIFWTIRAILKTRLLCSKRVEDPESKELRKANSIINSVAIVYIRGINFSSMLIILLASSIIHLYIIHAWSEKSPIIEDTSIETIVELGNKVRNAIPNLELLKSNICNYEKELKESTWKNISLRVELKLQELYSEVNDFDHFSRVVSDAETDLENKVFSILLSFIFTASFIMFCCSSIDVIVCWLKASYLLVCGIVVIFNIIMIFILVLVHAKLVIPYLTIAVHASSNIIGIIVPYILNEPSSLLKIDYMQVMSSIKSLPFISK